MTGLGECSRRIEWCVSRINGITRANVWPSHLRTINNSSPMSRWLLVDSVCFAYSLNSTISYIPSILYLFPSSVRAGL